MPAFQGLLKDCEAEVRAAAAGKVKGKLQKAQFKSRIIVIVHCVSLYKDWDKFAKPCFVLHDSTRRTIK